MWRLGFHHHRPLQSADLPQVAEAADLPQAADLLEEEADLLEVAAPHRLHRRRFRKGNQRERMPPG